MLTTIATSLSSSSNNNNTSNNTGYPKFSSSSSSSTCRPSFDASLPDEVLKLIASYLPIHSLLTARLLFKKMNKACDAMWVHLYEQLWSVPHRQVQLFTPPSATATNNNLGACYHRSNNHSNSNNHHHGNSLPFNNQPTCHYCCYHSHEQPWNDHNSNPMMTDNRHMININNDSSFYNHHATSKSSLTNHYATTMMSHTIGVVEFNHFYRYGDISGEKTLRANLKHVLFHQQTSIGQLTRQEKFELIWKELFFERFKILRQGTGKKINLAMMIMMSNSGGSRGNSSSSSSSSGSSGSSSSSTSHSSSSTHSSTTGGSLSLLHSPSITSSASSLGRLSLFHNSRSNHKKHDEDYYTDKGYSHIYRNNYTKAIHSFERSLSLKPSARAFEGLARIYQEYCESYPHVIIFAEAALQLQPVNPGELYYLRGKALFVMKRMREALTDFSRAIEYLMISPVNYHLFLKTSEVYYDRMMTNLELGHFDQAFADCEVVTRTDRMFQGGECFTKCTRVLYQMNQYTQAQRFLEKVENKTREYYELHMLVNCMLGDYKQALSSYRVYQNDSPTLFAPTRDSTPYTPNQNILIDIGIVLFMNNCFSEGIDRFCEHIRQRFEGVFASMTDRNITRAKELVFSAACRQVSEMSLLLPRDSFSGPDKTTEATSPADQDTNNDYSCRVTGIHMAWSFYYFTLGMLYFLHSSSTAGNNNTLEEAMRNFTTCITLNPTLSESFYYRSLIQCYILLNLSTSQSDGKRSHNNTNHTFEHTNGQSSDENNHHQLNSELIVRRITVINLMREALNDITNAITLVTIKLSDSLFGVGFDVVKLPTTQDNKREDTDLDTDQSNNIYCINLHLLRAYILNCFGRKSEALQECNLALDLDLKSRENDSSFASSHSKVLYTESCD